MISRVALSVLAAGALTCATRVERAHSVGAADPGLGGAGGAGDGGAGAGGDLDAGIGGSAECSFGEPGVCVPGSSEPCYEGPSGTEGMGSCAAGHRTCNAHGTAYEVCQDQALPRPDSCSSAAQWICDGQAAECNPLGLFELIDPLVTGVRIGADAAGGWARAYVALLDAPHLTVERIEAGQMTWSKQFALSTVGIDIDDVDAYVVAAVAVGADGSTFLAGNVAGDLALPGNPVVGPAAFLLALDASGSVAWSKALPSQSAEGWPATEIRAVAVSPTGDIVAAGEFYGELDLGGVVLKSAATDGFVARFDAEGQAIWATALGSAPTRGGLHSVALADDGTLYVGGYDDYQQAESCGHTAALLASFGPGGTPLWKKHFWSALGTSATTALVADSGGVYASGRIDTNLGNAMNLGGEPLDGTTFVARFSSAGDHVWSHATNDRLQGPAIGGYLGLEPGGRLIWADQDGYGFHLRTYDAVGQLMWKRTVTKAKPDEGNWFYVLGLYGFAILSDGRLAVGGSFTGALSFGGDSTSSEGHSGFFATFDP